MICSIIENDFIYKFEAMETRVLNRTSLKEPMS